MDEHGALYGARACAIDRDWLEARADGATVEDAGENGPGWRCFVLRWSDGTLVVTASGGLPEHLVPAMSARWERGEGDVEAARHMAGAKTLLYVKARDCSLTTPACLRWIRDRQRELDALLLVGDRVEDADGALRLTLPSEEEDEEPIPPEVDRVRRRAQILAVVVARAHLDVMPSEQGRLADLWEWLDRHDLWDEAEPAEKELIRTDRGKLPQRAVIDGTWRSEGLAVLAWALGFYELPAHDAQADPTELTQAVGLFADTLPSRFVDARLRSMDAIDWMAGRLLGLHWRLRDFSLRPVAMDYRAFAADNWFGGFDLEGIPLAEGDLAIGGAPIATCDPQARQIANSIARERHQAVNWLLGFHPVYSDVDTST